MCLICVEFDKGRMTTREARRALGEMAPKVGDRHAAEIEAKLALADAEATDPSGRRPSSGP